jgi:carbamoyltransferase
MRVLGINIFGHDHSVFIIDTIKKDIFAISLERVSRIKHDNNTLDLIVKEYQNEFKDIDYVCLGGGNKRNDFTVNIGYSYVNTVKQRSRFYKKFKPKYKKEQVELLNSNVISNPLKFGLINFTKYLYLRITNKFIYKNDFNQSVFSEYISKMIMYSGSNEIEYYDHHKSHAASAYYFSGFFDTKVISLTMDGYGDDFYSKVYLCENENMELIGNSKVRVINNATIGENLLSIGTLYGNFTVAMGLRRNSEEGKVEALAAYGNYKNEIYYDLLKSYRIVDNAIELNDDIEKYYTADYLEKIKLEHGDENFCAAIQAFLNDLMVDYTKYLKDKYSIQKICLSGGVTANVIMNLNILKKNEFKDIYVFPAMADDGVAAGAALLKLKDLGEDISFLSNMVMPYWGPTINYKNDLEKTLRSNNKKINFKLNENWPIDIAKKLMDDEVGAIVLGKMEYGPRALGNRSIIASPLNNKTRDKINSNIKKRPSYQPFCPSVLEEERNRLFSDALPNKHMTFAFRLFKEYVKDIPSAVHVDLTGRPQFVEENDNVRYYQLLREFKKISGYGIIINTSFNLHGRTIVRTPQDAIDDFLDCNLDFLVIENFVIRRKDL